MLQLSVSEVGDGNTVRITCTSLGGEALCTVVVQDTDSMVSVRFRIAEEAAIPAHRLRLVLPNGSVCSSVDATAQVNELFL